MASTVDPVPVRSQEGATRDFDNWFDWNGATTLAKAAAVNAKPAGTLDGRTVPISPVSVTLTDFKASTAHPHSLTAPPLPHDLPTPRHSSGSPEAQSSADIRLSGESLRAPSASWSLKRKLSHNDVPTIDTLHNEPTAPAKRRPHNIIEKRYRANLNEKITELRDSLNKASILTKAVEYIRHLELRTRRLEEENKVLKERMAELDRVIAHGPHDSQRSTAFTSQQLIEDGPSPQQEAQDAKADTTMAQESARSPPRGLIPMPDSWRRLRQGQGQEHYGHVYDTASARSPFRGKWPTRLMIGSLAGIVLMDGLSESDSGVDSKAKGLFGIPLELLDGWTFLNSPQLYLAMFAQYARGGGILPLVKGFCALTIVAFLIFAYLFNSKPAPKADLEGDAVCSDQRPAPASPIEVRRRAWSTSMQVLKLPHHSFFPEWLAITAEWLRWSVSHVFGYRAYFWLTGRSAEDDAIRIKAWDIAIDAQLAGGDPEASRSRVVLTSFGSGTLPRTPLRLMLKALHSRLLLWNVGKTGSLTSRLANDLATFVANRAWRHARELHAKAPLSSPDHLPANLSELLAMECDSVLTHNVLQRAYNLMYDRPTGEQAEDAMLDVVVEDHAVRSPLDAVAAWRSISALKTALDMSLQNPGQVHLFQEHLALALRIAPPGSAAETRALAALSLFGVSNRRACSLRASELLQSPTKTDGANSTAQVPYFIDSSTPPSARAEVENCLQCARICIAFEDDGDAHKAKYDFYHRPLKECTDSLITAAALKHVAAVIPGLSDQLLEVGMPPNSMPSATDRPWSPSRLQRQLQQRRQSNISRDTGYESLSDDSESNEPLHVNECKDDGVMADSEDNDVLWRIGVCDAHCHPTDIMASLNNIANMRAQALTVMATRSQDQHLVTEAAERFPLDVAEIFEDAIAKKYVVPSFGWHPWFSHQMTDDRDLGEGIDALQHYKTVLTPKCEDDDFLKSLPPPSSLSQYLRDAEDLLRLFPHALVGEVGLDRSFRLPCNGPVATGDVPNNDLDSEGEYTSGSREGRPLSPYRVSLQHQKAVLKAQFELAGKFRRPVSVHSVQTHGVVFDLLQSLWKGHEKPSKRARKRSRSATDAWIPENAGGTHDDEPLPYPPRICMHSYSGPPDALSLFLAPTVPADLYFSFSIVINFSTPAATKTEAVIRAVPDNRILIESDLHCAGQRMDGLLKEVIIKVCQLKGWELEDGARQLKKNCPSLSTAHSRIAASTRPLHPPASMVRLMSSGDNRFKLPARRFTPNDLVLSFPPPPSCVYNPSRHPSTRRPSSHEDYNHFGRMRKWLIQSCPNATWIFKGYDDFYPRDQTPSAPNVADTPRVSVFVNDVYGMYEVAHWDNVERQNSTSKKLLHLLGAAGQVDIELGGNEMGEGKAVDEDLLPFFRERQLLESPAASEVDGPVVTETAPATDPATAATVKTANPTHHTNQDQSNLHKQSPIKAVSNGLETPIKAQHLPAVTPDRQPQISSTERRLAQLPPPAGFFTPANFKSGRVYTVGQDNGDCEISSNRQQQASAPPQTTSHPHGRRARNILLFSLLLDKGYNANLDRIWNIYYHWKVDKASDALLKSKTLGLTKISESMDKWQNSQIGKHLRFCNSHTLRDVRDVWLHWLGSPDAVANEEVTKFHAEQYQEIKKHYRAKNGTGFSVGNLRSAAPMIPEALFRLENLGNDYCKDGGVFDDPESKAKADIINRTLFATGKRRSILHYGTQPFLSFHLAEVFARRINKPSESALGRSLHIAKAEFKTWADAFRAAIDHGLTIRFFAGDALALANTLQFMAQGPGNTTAHIKSHSCTFETLTLDSGDYVDKGGAPTMYDMIDTSNLFDHVGALNVLVSASPLLKPAIQSSLFTETMVQCYKDVKARNEALLAGNFNTVSLLLGLTVVESWTNATLAPETDEGIYTTILKDSHLGSPRQQTTRQCWKRLTSFGISRPALDSKTLVPILSSIFKEIFRHEDLFKMISVRKSALASAPHHTRFAFAALIKLMHRNVDANTWGQVLPELLQGIGVSGLFSMYGNYTQDLFVALDLLDIYVDESLRLQPEIVVPPKFASWLRDWKPLPRLVCVSIQVPLKLLAPMLAPPPLKRPNPVYCLSLESSQKCWSHTFGAVQIGYGTIISTSDDARCLIEEDPSGIHGKSDLIVSAFVPTSSLLRDAGRFNVAVRFQYTRLNTVTNLPIPSFGNNMHVFSARLTDTRAVRLSATWPGTATSSPTATDATATTHDLKPETVKDLWPKYLSKEVPWVTPDQLPGIREQVLVLRASAAGGPFSSAACGLQLEGEHEAASASPDVPARSEAVSPFEITVTIENLAPLIAKFPFPVSGIQVNRTPGYVVVIGQATGFHQRLHDPELVLPMSVSDSRLVLSWTAPYIALDQQPIVHWIFRSRHKNRLSWLELHLSTMFSDQEVVLERTPTRSPGMRRDFKNSLANMFLIPMGLHPRMQQRRSLFSLVQATGDHRVEFLIVISTLRVDLTGRSVVADAIAIPLTPEIDRDPIVVEFMTKMPADCAQHVPLPEDQLTLWKHALPVFAERCRTWAHVPETCQYLLNGGKVPPSSMLAEGASCLCSCGKGKFPDHYPVNIDLPLVDYVMRNYGTRIALSPVFPVIYLEECTGPTILKWEDM
ncbi:hypothetical protein DV736_g439, partial [Chaetothyriales sp. CBS 134916]